MKTVALEFDDGIAWVTMNRPEKKNAISVEMAREMAELLDRLETNARCQVLVLTGAGESFSAGMDLKDYFRATDDASPVERAGVYRPPATSPSPRTKRPSVCRRSTGTSFPPAWCARRSRR